MNYLHKTEIPEFYLFEYLIIWLFLDDFYYFY